jgi:hypothetical protein
VQFYIQEESYDIGIQVQCFIVVCAMDSLTDLDVTVSLTGLCSHCSR